MQKGIFRSSCAALLIAMSLTGSVSASGRAVSTDDWPREAQRVKDICPGACSSGPWFLTESGGFVYFSADDGVHGGELWRSDGSAKGTVLVKDINPGPAGSFCVPYLVSGNDLYLLAYTDPYGWELWKSDGTSQGTDLVADIFPGPNFGDPPWELTRFQGNVYFSARDGIHGRELWRTDGTEGGTVMVKDIHPGPFGGLDIAGEGRSRLHVGPAGHLLFAADDGIHGSELWRSDGSQEGTVLLMDINEGSDSSRPMRFFRWGGRTYFQANDGSHGFELWATDGTAAGTALVADIKPGAGNSWAHPRVGFGPHLLLSANDGDHGFELWKTDGSSQGTEMVADIAPGADSSQPGFFSELHGGLIFRAATPEHGPELWWSDASLREIHMLRDIFPGPFTGVGLPAEGEDLFARFGDELIFQGITPELGRELWATDGTRQGTRLLQDIAPGRLSSGASWFLAADSALFFAASDGHTGSELWALPTKRPAQIFSDGFESGDSWAWSQTVP